MVVLFVSLLKFVIYYDFFSHSKHMFILYQILYSCFYIPFLQEVSKLEALGLAVTLGQEPGF